MPKSRGWKVRGEGRRVLMTSSCVSGSVHQRGCLRRWAHSQKTPFLILVSLSVVSPSLMPVLMLVLVLCVLTNIKYLIGMTYAFGGVRVNAWNYLNLIPLRSFSLVCRELCFDILIWDTKFWYGLLMSFGAIVTPNFVALLVNVFWHHCFSSCLVAWIWGFRFLCVICNHNNDSGRLRRVSYS